MSMPNKKLLAAGIAAGSLLLWGCQDRGPSSGQTADYQFQQEEPGQGGAGDEGYGEPLPADATAQTDPQQGTGGSGETGLNTDQPVSGVGTDTAGQPNPDGYGDTAGNADTTMDTSAPTGMGGSGDVAPGGLGGTGENTDNDVNGMNTATDDATGGAGTEGTGQDRVTDPRMEPGTDFEPGSPEAAGMDAGIGGAGVEDDFDSADGVTGTTGEQTDTATGTPGTQSESGSQQP